jgi:hypothetical protein
VKIPKEKETIINRRSFRRPELDITEAAKKTRIPRRQGLNPARRPAAKTEKIVDNDILRRSISSLPLRLLLSGPRLTLMELILELELFELEFRPEL